MKIGYNRRIWLNTLESDSTGSVVAFDGFVTYGDSEAASTFIEIADCKHKIRLHLTSDDTKEDFIRKMELLNSELGMFINYLKKNQNDGKRNS